LEINITSNLFFVLQNEDVTYSEETNKIIFILL